ncbi:hypothetical protein [Erysipelothrix piscisicarius]|uniref:hypothetical protein n=1 Tax=Erysipelothrix piscisicarius TaxID=2485784 RepID=UPI001E3DC37F|nr:hypothetical protein [Erysipelothrix piscisicarius]
MNPNVTLDGSKPITEAAFIEALNIQNPDGIAFDIETNFMELVDQNTEGTYAVTVRLTRLQRSFFRMKSNPYVKEFKVDVTIQKEEDKPIVIDPNEKTETPTTSTTPPTTLPTTGVGSRNVTTLITLGGLMYVVSLKKKRKQQ